MLMTPYIHWSPIIWQNLANNNTLYYRLNLNAIFHLPNVCVPNYSVRSQKKHKNTNLQLNCDSQTAKTVQNAYHACCENVLK